MTDNIRVIPSRLLAIAGILLCAYVSIPAQVGDYEGRPVAAVEVTFEGSPPDPTAQAEFQSLLKIVAGGEYSAVKAHQSLQDLFASGRVASGRVEITEVGAGRDAPVRVRFVVQRQIVIAGVSLTIVPPTAPIAKDEIRHIRVTHPPRPGRLAKKPHNRSNSINDGCHAIGDYW